VNIRENAKRMSRDWLTKNANNTVARFRTLLRGRMDMNATQIHDNVVRHLLENGLSPERPRSVNAELEYKKWNRVYEQFNVTEKWFHKLVEPMLSRVAEGVQMTLYTAYKPLAAYQAERDAKQKCVDRATIKVADRIGKIKGELEVADEGEKRAEQKVAEQLGHDDGIQDKIIALMKQVQGVVTKKGSQEMKTNYANALEGYEAAMEKMKLKPEPAGAMGEAVVAANAMTQQLDIAATTWADPEGAQIMQWKLEIEELKNPPPAPGQFVPSRLG